MKKDEQEEQKEKHNEEEQEKEQDEEEDVEEDRKNEMEEKEEVVKKGRGLITVRKAHGGNTFSLGKFNISKKIKFEGIVQRE